MKSIKTLCWLVLLLIIAWPASSQTIAYRFDTNDIWVLPKGDPKVKHWVTRTTGTYKVGDGVIAIKDSNTLYVASAKSKWKPVRVSGGVDSYEVQQSKVFFRVDNTLYQVISFVKAWKMREPIARGIRDYNLYGPQKRYVPKKR